MCGITGVFGRENSVVDVIASLEVMKSRGVDSLGLASDKDIFIAKNIASLKKREIDFSEGVVGHNLHSVVSNTPQPLLGDGILLTNCEIYNWKELDKRHNFGSKNDAELLFNYLEYFSKKKPLNARDVDTLTKDFDGVYAFCYWDLKRSKLFLARDIIGEKPLWFSSEDGFFFASERKALLKIGCRDIKELNPRTILEYDISKGKLTQYNRSFFRVGKLTGKSDEQIIQETENLLLSAIKKRVPQKKLGILFSGGIDSLFLAYMCKKIGVDFTCYTAVLEEEGMGEAHDLIAAKETAKEFGFKLKVKKISLDEAEYLIKEVMPLIEDNNVVKVGVAMTMHAACKLAAKDNVKVMFSGLGSEEIFAGYERHKNSGDINKECLSGLLKLYERDLYRDDVVTMANGMELRLPFLDKHLVEFSLKIPVDMKLNSSANKIILRDVAKRQGIPENFSLRKKKAAQYGSKFDRAIQKLAKKKGMKKSEYLESVSSSNNPILGVLWSGGKDSAYAMWTMMKQNYKIACLVSMKSKNPDSYMFHTPNIDIVEMHASAASVPIVVSETKGEKEKELSDLKKALQLAKKKHGIEGVVTGALYSDYQRTRIEEVCDSLGLKIFSPLWHIDQEKEMRDIVAQGFEVIISSVAAYGLDDSWLGTKIDNRRIESLVKLREKYSINVAGEGGEFESLVLDAPFFSKRIGVTKSRKYFDNDGQGRFLIEEAKFSDKI